MQPSISVAVLNEGRHLRFLLMLEEWEFVRAVGPFTEDECREELARRGVPPAAADARIMKARRAFPSNREG